VREELRKSNIDGMNLIKVRYMYANITMKSLCTIYANKNFLKNLRIMGVFICLLVFLHVFEIASPASAFQVVGL
jgi:hypothetical protein